MDEQKKDRLLRLIIIAIAVLIGIGAIVLLVQAVQAVFFPVLGAVVVIWCVFGDKIADNWRANKQRQALEQQQRQQQYEAQVQGMYYHILRAVVQPMVESMIGKSVPEELLIYRGEPIYGNEWLYYRWPVEIHSVPNETEVRGKIGRRLSQETGVRYAELMRQECISIRPGHDGEILILVKLPDGTQGS